MKEETLSDWFTCKCNCCARKKLKVKEFIRRLKEETKKLSPNTIFNVNPIINIIDKFTGDDLK